MPNPRTALACLTVLALAGCGAGSPPPEPLSVTERGPDPADHAVAIRCAAQAGVLFSHYAGGVSARPPTDREAKAAVRARIADSYSSLHRQRLRLTAAPHPHNDRFVVVTAAAAHGSSTFTLARGENGGIQVRDEQICYPPRKGPPLPTTTRLPQRVPDYPDACSGRLGPLRRVAAGVTGWSPVAAAKARVRDPGHPLHGRKVYVPPVPKPYGQRTTVVAEFPHGPSRIQVERGRQGGWVVTAERICHPPGP